GNHVQPGHGTSEAPRRDAPAVHVERRGHGASVIRGDGPIGALALCLLALFTVEVIASKPTFTSSWKAPDANGVTFTGKKVAALVISEDQNLRASGEEQLVRELTARGIQGVATYR